MKMDDIFKKIDFQDAVEIKKEWRTSLPAELLSNYLEEDERLYETDKDKIKFLKRRLYTIRCLSSDWENIVNRACWEAIGDKNDATTKEFHQAGLHASLSDFIQHIFYFETVRRIILTKEKVNILGENMSTVHDIDKLHPIMLAGYAEKFQDGKDTSLWKACVQNHIKINPHHQDNPLWKDGNCEESKISKNECSHCEELRNFALLEMICDKVSRKLQKEHRGKVCNEMWDVDPKYFEGLPSNWLTKAYKIIDEFKVI